MADTSKKIQELMLLKMSLGAIKTEVINQLDAMAAQIDHLIPDADKFRGRQPQTKKEWKAEVASWK